MESRYTWKNQLLSGLRSFAVGGGIILVLVYLLLVSGEAAREELGELLVEEKGAVTHIDEPVVYGYENGAKTWELRSEVAEQERETESSELERIYELILFKGGEENILIRGDHGDWDKPREKLILTGNVVVESGDGTTLLDTEKLIWEERNKILSCPEFVDFWVEDNHIIANSLYSDDDLATIDFVGDVEMFVIGMEGENFVTREGDFPIEDIEDEESGEGMNVLAEYVHYDKGDRICLCFPFIPLRIQHLHNIDEEGQTLPEKPPQTLDLTSLLHDPGYVDTLQRSVSELDLGSEERAFLEGEIDLLPQDTDVDSIIDGDTPASILPEFDEDTIPGLLGAGEFGGGIDPDELGVIMVVGTSPFGGLGLSGGIPSPDDELMGPVVDGPLAEPEGTPIDLPTIPRADPNVVLTSSDYSHITDWQISPNLDAEIFEGDANFDPYAETRDGLVFCYRNNKKIWCEELHIFLGDHIIEALRQADARFRDLRDEDSAPAESRAGRAIQESPTQFIGNYLIHNWREDVTEGYGRVLAIQDEKDIEADNVIYYEESDVIHAWGDVIVHQFSGQWWVTSGAIEDIEDERARKDIRNPTVITTDALLSYSRQVTWGFGNVVFRQEEQVITSDRAQYEENTEILVMAGNVDYDNEDGEQLECELLTMDLFLDEYIAEGAAIARNIVPEDYRENLAEFRGDEDTKPEDFARTRLLENRTSVGLGDWSTAIENPPPPPPIEIMPGAESKPDLGPDIPKHETGSGVSDNIDQQEMEYKIEYESDPLLLEESLGESNTGMEFTPGTGSTDTGVLSPTGDESLEDETIVEEDETETVEEKLEEDETADPAEGEESTSENDESAIESDPEDGQSEEEGDSSGDEPIEEEETPL